MGTRKLLAIGLDGATFDTLLPLVERGHMPNLAALMERGSWGRLASTIPPFTAAAWSTFITGRNPGQHGVLSFRDKRDRFHYDLQGTGFVDARRYDLTIWDILSTAGKRVGIVNVPMTYPAHSVNGYMVTGMLTPPHAAQFTYPPELAEALGSDYVIDLDFIRDEDSFRIRGFPPKTEMMAQIRHMLSVRARTCSRLMQEQPTDFFMVVFTSTDRVQHFFWDDLANMIARPSPNGTADVIERQIAEYFEELDERIGQLTKLAGPSATVLVISDHGFGPAPTHRFYMNIWLEQLGLLQRRGRASFLDLEYWRVMLGRNRHLKALLRRLMPQAAQDKAKQVAESTSGGIIDWSRSRAYFVPLYFHVGGVEINLAGARREGIVEPGRDYEILRDRIIHQATQLQDPRNGKPIVELAARREELYQGPHVESFPDVILVLDPDYICSASLAGSSLIEFHAPMRSGEHRQDGIFIAAGPSIAQRGELSNLRLLDVPPTILYSMDLPVPSFFDGQVLKEAFDPAYLSAHPVQSQEWPSIPRAAEQAEQAGFSEAEQAEIEGRLRGLGYLD